MLFRKSYGVVALLAVWLVAGLGVWFVRSHRMTTEKAVAYLEAHRLEGLPAEERARVIQSLAEQVNQLSFEERQKFRYEDRLRERFQQMTPAEQHRYIDLTLPKGLKQMMTAFNEMTPAKRKQIVTRALADIGRMHDEAGLKDAKHALSDANLKRIVDDGMKSFIRDASADTKLDLQPVIEQIQLIMHRAR